MRKYESDAMAPKADIRAKIAKALNIDLEAISDVEISSFADIMYVLFELEEKYGLKIEKKEIRFRTLLGQDFEDELRDRIRRGEREKGREVDRRQAAHNRGFASKQRVRLNQIREKKNVSAGWRCWRLF